MVRGSMHPYVLLATEDPKPAPPINRTFWISLATVQVLTASFVILERLTGVTLLDLMWRDPGEVQRTIDSMTAEQRSVHIWITCTLDVVNPIAIAGVFKASAQVWGRKASRFTDAMNVMILADYSEGVVQVLALSGRPNLAFAKVLLTDLKFGLGMVGGASCLAWLLTNRESVIRFFSYYLQELSQWYQRREGGSSD